jgi:hypothetical protein
MNINSANQPEMNNASQGSPLPPTERHSPYAQAFLDAVHEKMRATGIRATANIPSDESELLRIASILERMIRDLIESFAYRAYEDVMKQFPEYKIPHHIWEQYRKTLLIHPRIAPSSPIMPPQQLAAPQ